MENCPIFLDAIDVSCNDSNRIGIGHIGGKRRRWMAARVVDSQLPAAERYRELPKATGRR